MKASRACEESPQTQTQTQTQTLLHFPSSPLKPLLDSSSAFPTAAVTAATAPIFYEPTSVLDSHHLTSSPAVPDLAPLHWDAIPPPPPPPLLPEDWDPVASWLLSDRDDFPKPPLPHFPEPDDNYFPHELDFRAPAPPPTSFDGAQLDLLLRAAHAVESADYASAHAILARLNLSLHSPAGSPLQRAALYFKDALQALLLRPLDCTPLSAAELVRRIAAHKAFSDLSPIPQFVSFTANQALLEALPAEAPVLHVIDFDLGLGGQWSSFIQELAARSRAAARSAPRLRLTAVVPDGDLHAAEAALAADNLQDFAAGLGLRLSVDRVRLATIALGGVRLSAGEPSAVVLSPAVLSPDSAAAVLRFIRRASPRVILFVDTECCFPAGSAGGPPSFRRSFVSGLEHCAAVLESLDAAAAAAGAGEEPVRRVERVIVRPRAAAAVAAWAAPARPGPWGDFFAGAGWAPAPLSEFAESQAEWLLQRSPIHGFHLERKEGSMVLSWRGRELAATSAWRC